MIVIHRPFKDAQEINAAVEKIREKIKGTGLFVYLLDDKDNVPTLGLVNGEPHTEAREEE